MAQTLDRLTHGFVGQAPRAQPLLEGDIGQQVQCPGAAGFAEAPRGLVQEALERIGLGRVEDRLGILGTAFLFAQAVGALVLEGVDGVAHRADGAAELCGDVGWSLPVGAGQQDLGPPQRERLAAPQPGLECVTLRIGEFSNK